MKSSTSAATATSKAEALPVNSCIIGIAPVIAVSMGSETLMNTARIARIHGLAVAY